MQLMKLKNLHFPRNKMTKRREGSSIFKIFNLYPFDEHYMVFSKTF